MADLTLPNANMHNKKYRGKDLTETYSVADILAQIRNNTFDDLYIGDYIILENAPYFDGTSVSSYTMNARVIFAGFNTYLYTGNSSSAAQYQTPHAIVLVGVGNMEYQGITNDEPVPYYSTSMYTTYLPNLYDAYVNNSDSEVAAFGAAILNQSVLLPSAFDTSLKNICCTDTGNGDGASSNFTWTTCRFRPLSEIERCGSTVFSSSPYYDTGSCNRHLPLFKLNSNNINCGYGDSYEPTIGIFGSVVNQYVIYSSNGRPSYSIISGDDTCYVMAMIG